MKTNLTYKILNETATQYGDSFYVLNSSLFKDNYYDMLNCFKKYYDNTHIAYSYKTNYIPKLCQIINDVGGYAEIVSEMEMWLALKVGVNPDKIFYNGPYKKEKYIKKLLLLGGHINIDSSYEVCIVEKIACEYPENEFNVGIRCSGDIEQEDISRFGFDFSSGKLAESIERLEKIENVHINGLHCHLPYRSLESFKKRMIFIKEILNKLDKKEWEYISLGGGYMGKIDSDFAQEFSFMPPTYKEYAEVVAGEFSDIFSSYKKKPKLIIEPGSALVANTMKYVTRVVDIKQIRDKKVATLTGSTYNMNPSVKGIKRPIQVYSDMRNEYNNLDMAGYTCIESDYLFRNYQGKLQNGDFVVFENVGSYSIVMKPPFILPDVVIVEVNKDMEIKIVKKAQKEIDVFGDYIL